MRFEFLNQKGVLNFDIQKKYPLIWHEDENGKHVDEFSITPVKGKIELSADIIIDTGDLKATDILELMRTYEKLDSILSEKRCEKLCKEAREE